MVLTEDFAAEVEIRPGRRIFVRKVSIGGGGGGGGSSPLPRRQLICAHGTCATERQYQLFLEALDKLLCEKRGTTTATATPLSCLLFDNVGCGQSPPLHEWDAYANAEIAADLRAVIQRHADPTLRTVYVGHSYAPSIFLPLLRGPSAAAGGLAAVVVPHLAGCILLSTAVRDSPHLPLPDGGHWMMRLPLPLLRCLQPHLTQAFVQRAIHPDHAALRAAIIRDSNANRMYVAQAYHRQMQWATLKDVQLPPPHGSDAAAVAAAALPLVPVLIVHGADDGVIPVECGQHLRNHLPHAELVIIERASHLVMIEQADQVALAAYNFLARCLL